MLDYLRLAALLCFLLGLVHSLLGERLIFNKLRKKRGTIKSTEQGLLSQRHFGILWASWHILSLFGWCIAYLFLSISKQAVELLRTTFRSDILSAISICMSISAILILIATKAKHPGWIILLAIALLTFLEI